MGICLAFLQVVVTVGVAIASYGEINFVVIGVILQLISVATESTRLTLVQILLQVSGCICCAMCFSGVRMPAQPGDLVSLGTLVLTSDAGLVCPRMIL